MENTADKIPVSLNIHSKTILWPESGEWWKQWFDQQYWFPFWTSTNWKNSMQCISTVSAVGLPNFFSFKSFHAALGIN